MLEIGVSVSLRLETECKDQENELRSKKRSPRTTRPLKVLEGKQTDSGGAESTAL